MPYDNRRVRDRLHLVMPLMNRNAFRINQACHSFSVEFGLEFPESKSVMAVRLVFYPRGVSRELMPSPKTNP